MMELNRKVRIGIGAGALLLAWGMNIPAHADTPAETTYKAKCAACHGPDGSGDTVVGKKLGTHDLRSAEVQKMTDAELTEILAKGKNKMPAYEKSLKPDEIKGLVAYLHTLAPKK
jgi:mono/diheme cytochrome c family protein